MENVEWQRSARSTTGIEGRPKQSVDVSDKRAAEEVSKLTDDEPIAEIKEQLASFEADGAPDAS
jgi:hypothetical protein